jgi:hypothetical protein
VTRRQSHTAYTKAKATVQCSSPSLNFSTIHKRKKVPASQGRETCRATQLTRRTCGNL